MSFLKHLFRKGEKDILTNMTFNKPSEPTQQDLTAILCQTWQQLDVNILEPFLDENFRYNSVWVGKTLKGKRDYLQYIKGKFETLKNTDNCPIMDVVNEYGKVLPHFQQGKNEGVLDYEQKDGKILSMLMRPVLKIKVVSEPEWRIYADAYHEFLPQTTRIAVQSINEIAQREGLDQSEFAWLQTFPNYPSFQHLCFRTSSQVFSILIAIHGFTSNGEDDNGIVVNKRDYDRLIMETEKNHLVPCIFPICGIPQIPMLGGTHLIHAKTGAAIDIKKEYDYNNGRMSPWEINNFGVWTVIHYLQDKQCTNISYCDVIGIQPQIFFEKDGKHAFILVRTLPIGMKNQPFEINKNLLKKYSGYEGYFADVQFARFHNTGSFNDKYMPRGDSFYSNFRGLQDLKTAIRRNDFIILVEKENYEIQA